MNETLTKVIILLVLVGVTFGVTRWQFPRVETVVEYEQEEIDEGVWVRRSSYQQRGNIIDSLRKENETLADEVSSRNEQIANYTQIIGQLNTQRDSLESKVEEYQLALDDEGQLVDSSYTFTETFGDSLFEVSSRVGISQGMISNTLELRQIRDVNINVVTTVSDRQDLVMTYVQSDDFIDLQYTSSHSLHEGRFSKTQWFLIGTGVGVIFSAGLIIAL